MFALLTQAIMLPQLCSLECEKELQKVLLAVRGWSGSHSGEHVCLN